MAQSYRSIRHVTKLSHCAKSINCADLYAAARWLGGQLTGLGMTGFELIAAGRADDVAGLDAQERLRPFLAARSAEEYGARDEGTLLNFRYSGAYLHPSRQLLPRSADTLPRFNENAHGQRRARCVLALPGDGLSLFKIGIGVIGRHKPSDATLYAQCRSQDFSTFRTAHRAVRTPHCASTDSWMASFFTFSLR